MSFKCDQCGVVPKDKNGTFHKPITRVAQRRATHRGWEIVKEVNLCFTCDQAFEEPPIPVRTVPASSQSNVFRASWEK